MRIDERFMRRALILCKTAAGRTKTNPLVGCVIVKDGRVIAEGFHEVFGGPHAEAIALRMAGAKARGSTLYATLEPCMPFAGKKTPSCALALLAAKPSRVVIAMADPHPSTAGKGIALLRKAGIKVDVGVLEHESVAINAPFLKLVKTGLPFVHLKMAVSSDGFIWSPKVRFISQGPALKLSRHLRNELDAIMVGVGTVLADDPRLTCRLPKGRDPLRVVVDSRLRCPLKAKVFDDANCIVFTASGYDKRKKAALEKKGVRVFSTPGRRVSLKAPLKQLAGLNVSSVLLEGGRELAQSFIDAGLVDAFTLIISKKKLGNGVKAPRFGPLEVMSARKLGGDLVVEAKPLLQAPQSRRS